MLRKALLGLVICAWLVSGISTVVLAEGMDDAGSTISEEADFVIENGVLTQYTGSATQVVIPDGVTEIGKNAFYFNERMEMVQIPDTVIKIDHFAFYHCSKLGEVTIPDSVTEIGNNAFIDCRKLTKLKLSSNLKTVGDGVFRDCDGLTEVEIPKSIQTVYGLFWGCDNLRTITFETGTTTIPKDIFAFCNGLEKIEIPEGVNEIGDSAFSSCENLQEVILPESLITIGDWAFNSCESLTTVNLPKNLETLGYAAFASCNALESIEIPKSITSTEMPFDHCEGLKTATFECGISEILPTLFQSCIALENVIIPDTVTEIGEDAFFNCISLKEIIIPDSVEKIGSGAFSCCESLTNLTLSKCLKDAGQYCFAGCVALNEVEIPKSLVNAYAMFDSCISLKTVTFETGTTQIAGGLFSDCDGLEEITIPDTVECIPVQCFELCDNLSKVNLPKNLKSIDGLAFKESGIKEIEVPEGANYIGDRAFEKCTELEKITIPRSVIGIATTAFSGADNVTIYCMRRSVAENYAIEQGITYIAQEIPAEEVTLNITEKSIQKGFSFVLEATITPADHTDVLIWSSSDESVATVSEYGFVTAYSAGNADITLTVGEISTTCKVTVIEPMPSPSPTQAPVPSTPEEQVYAFVERMYTVAFGRESDESGAQWWTEQLLAKNYDGASLSVGFIMSEEFAGKNYSNEEYVTVLYSTFFDRVADDGGKAHWTAILENGSTRAEVLAGFVNSDEFFGICESYGISKGVLRSDGSAVNPGIYLFAERLYTKVFGRSGEKDGMEYWSLQIDSRECAPEDAAIGFFFSDEYLNKKTVDEEYIKTLYRTFMGREADAGGLSYWKSAMDNGMNRQVVLSSFAHSDEFKGIMAEYGL